MVGSWGSAPAAALGRTTWGSRRSPANIAKRIVAGLVADGAITRSTVGIVPGALQDLENFYALALNTGVLNQQCRARFAGGPCGLAGGDILLAIDGAPVDGRFPEQLPPIQNLIASQPVGAKLRLTYKRGATTADLNVVTENWRAGWGGVALENGILVFDASRRTFAREISLSSDHGVIVIGVQSGFPAEVAGLSRGDVITKINQQPGGLFGGHSGGSCGF